MTALKTAGKYLLPVLCAGIAVQTVWLVASRGGDGRVGEISLHKMPRKIAGAAEKIEPGGSIIGCSRKYLDRRLYYGVTVIPGESSGRVQLFFTADGRLIARDRFRPVAPGELPFAPSCPKRDIVSAWEHVCLGRTFYSVTDVTVGEAVKKWYFPDGEPIPAADSPLSAVSSIRPELIEGK